MPHQAPFWARALALVLGTLALSACGAGPEPVTYEEVLLELLRSPERLDVRREPPRHRVRIQAVTPVRAVASGSGNRPALIIPPGAEIAYDLPDLGPDTSLALSLGVAWADHDEARGKLEFVGEFNGEPVLEQSIPIGGRDRDRRGWIDHRIDVSGGGELTLRCSSPIRGLRSAVADLTLQQTRSVVPAPSSVERPNLVLVVIDTLRSDRLSAYGYERPTTPVLDTLAERGVLWRDAWSVAPWTWPSTASILTGEEPPAHGVLDRFSCYLPDSSDTLAELVRREGFATAGFSSNPLISAEQNFGQGFDRFVAEDWTRSSEFLDPALDALGGFGERRFLLYLHLTDPHLPFEPEPDLRAQFVDRAGPNTLGLGDFAEDLAAGRRDDPALVEALQHLNQMYDAEVAAADRAVGRVVERLAELGLDDRTLVVVTSDHGEELFEHGLLGHSHQLFREALIVPLIAAGPGLPAGRAVEASVQNHRLLPSLLDWLGLDVPAGLPERLPLDDGAPAPAMRFGTEVGDWMATGTSERMLARREGDELVLWMEAGDRLAVYDTGADPQERNDLIADRPEPAGRARDDLARWWKRQSALRPISLSGGESTAEMLRALGYLNEDD